MPLDAGVGGDGRVDRLDPGGGDDEAHTVEVAGLVGAPAKLAAIRCPVELLVDLGGDDADVGAGRDEPGDLPDGDRPGADDQHRHAVEVEHDRVPERDRWAFIGQGSHADREKDTEKPTIGTALSVHTDKLPTNLIWIVNI